MGHKLTANLNIQYKGKTFWTMIQWYNDTDISENKSYIIMHSSFINSESNSFVLGKWYIWNTLYFLLYQMILRIKNDST